MTAARFSLLVLFLAGPASAEDYALPPPPLDSHVDYSADTVEFDGEKSTLHLSGGVVLKTFQTTESTVTIKGEDLWIDTARRAGRSVRPLLIDDGVSAVYGESGEFDFAKRTSRLLRSSIGVGDWRIHAREAKLYPDRRMRFRSADFTSCERAPADYHFHASSVRVVPKKYVLAKNTLFYLGKAPVFYTPIFYRSLNPNPRLRWRFQPGYDRRNGHYIKGTLTTQLTPTTYSKIFDDYYSEKGFGYGAELDHHAGEDSRGSLFGYRIQENATVNDRWGLFGGGYQNLGSSISFHGRLQFQSDSGFTNDYVRSDVFRLTPRLINSGALTRTFTYGTLRLLYSREDVQSPENSRSFVKDRESTPRVEAQSTPLRIWKLPWLNTFSGFADNNYTRGRVYHEKSLNGAWNGTRNFSVARGINFTPSLSYSETYYNRFDLTNFAPPVTNRNLDSFIGRWTASNNLRFNTPLGDIDATHSYGKRLKPNAFTEDTGPADKGVESNLLTLTDVFVPAPRMWARLTSGYDYRTFRDRALGYQERLQPIALDMSWQSSKSLIFFLHNDYKLGEGNRSVIADVLWGDPQGTSVGGGIFYNLATPGTYYQSLDFSIGPSSPTWRLAVGLRSLVMSPGGFSRAHSLRVFEKEIMWSRRWHDFYTKLIGRLRPGGVGEVTVRIEFKFGSADPKQARRRNWEAEWFPGRAKESDDLRP